MAESIGVRQLSEDEKKLGGINEIGAPDVRKIFSKKVHDKEQEHTRAHTPFDRRCALLDFDDLLEQKKKDLMRRYSYVKSDNKELLQLDIKDLDRYADLDRFEKGPSDEVVEYKLIDGVRQPYVTGIYESYVCKQNGCKISVFVPVTPVNREALQVAGSVKKK